MTSERIKRFKERQDRLARAAASSDGGSVLDRLPRSTTPPEDIGVFEAIEARYSEIEKLISRPVAYDIGEAEAMLVDIRSRWDEKKLDVLLSGCKTAVISSVLGPFGLGALASTWDKDGGNVSTVHNAKKGIFANEADEQRYNEAFDRKDYEKGTGNNFKKRRKEAFKEDADIIDIYTGKTLPKDTRAQLDHKVSAHEVHQGDDHRRLTMEKSERVRVANKDENLGFTDGSLNQSKGKEKLKDWNETQRKDGQTNAERYGTDPERVAHEDKVSRDSLKKETLKAATKKYGHDLLATGAQEAAKMGLQQALGVLLCEFFVASHEQVVDAYKHGFKDSLTQESFFDALKRRLLIVAERIANKWQDVWAAFVEGSISGFLSNLVTFIINSLMTTGKRVVQVIREGFFSILKAVKLALFPPEGLTKEEAFDAALKLLATGVITGVGVMAEEAVEKAVFAFFSSTLPVLAPLAGLVAAVFTGAMVGIASSVVVFGLDQLDIFGVQGEKRHEFVMQELDALIAVSAGRIDDIYTDIMNPLGLPKPSQA
jgi:hypothetical protein